MPRICKVLIVEDHEGVRALLGDLFDDEGYRFTLAADGEAMRQEMTRGRHDIVVIDVSLRSEDGFALAEYAADQGAGVILTTGDRRLFENVKKSGHRYLMKPFMAPSLIELVQEVLRETETRCTTRKRRAIG
jgi:two-component system nitrogen regulation response regulator NtrX